MTPIIGRHRRPILKMKIKIITSAICVYARPGIIILIVLIEDVFIENGGRGAPVPPTAQLPPAACRLPPTHPALFRSSQQPPALSPLNHRPLTATHMHPLPPRPPSPALEGPVIVASYQDACRHLPTYPLVLLLQFG
jgi:hypothetical protein